MTQPVAVGVDVGGTNLRAAGVSATGQMLDQVRRPTPAGSAATLLDALEEVIEGYPDGLPVGIGIAGLVSREGEVRYGPNIGVRNLPLAARLGERLGRDVSVVNDGSAATFAEQRVGAGQGLRDVVMLTMGTGVGGGLTVDGQLVLGRSGFAGELGHLIVAEGGRVCPCGNRGCIEAYASGTAIAALAAERLGDGSDASSKLHGLDSVDGQAIGEAAKAGDRLAQHVLEEVGGWLGVAVAGLVNALDPDVVLIGGGAAVGTAEWVLPAARRSMTDRLLGGEFRDPPPTRLAVLGDDAGTVGAALFAHDQHARPGGAE